VEKAPSGLLTLTFSNRGKKNALDAPVLEALAQALARHPEARCILVRGEGEAFSAGYDLGALTGLKPHDALPDTRLGEVFDLLEQHPAPSVAAVRGPAYGAGFELACACDFRVAEPSAVFCAPPARLGIVYAPKGLARVAKVVGWQRARLLFLTGRTVDAATALAIGLVDEVGTAEALCATLLAQAPKAVAGMRKAFALLQEAEGERITAQLEGLRRSAFLGEEAQEGLAAAREKRPPRF
jgi:enoyl-CoA hydratase/carnithine racemase